MSVWRAFDTVTGVFCLITAVYFLAHISPSYAAAHPLDELDYLFAGFAALVATWEQFRRQRSAR